MFAFPTSRRLFATLGLGLGFLVLCASQGRPADDVKADPEAVARTRDVVKMVDSLNKGYIVGITQTYVKARENVPAARIAKRVFKSMAEQGHMTGRLIDVSGKPVDEANVAQGPFETRAAAAIKGGKAYFEEVAADKNGKAVLRAATVVPVVMKACIECHPGTKEGDVLGALVYELPIR